MCNLVFQVLRNQETGCIRSNMESDGVARFLLQQNGHEHFVKKWKVTSIFVLGANIRQNVSNLGKTNSGPGFPFKASVNCRKMTGKKITIK